MTDLDIAVLVVKAAAEADSGCWGCARQVLDEARRLQPDLPWGMAIDGLDDDGSYQWAKDNDSVG